MENTDRTLLAEKPATHKDFRGLVVVNDKDELIVIATTEDCRAVDLFINGYGADDNGIECQEKLSVGFYEMSFQPWSRQDYQGDYDCCINATVISKLVGTPLEYLKD